VLEELGAGVDADEAVDDDAVDCDAVVDELGALVASVDCDTVEVEDCDTAEEELGASVASVDCDTVEEVATVVLGASVACDDVLEELDAGVDADEAVASVDCDTVEEVATVVLGASEACDESVDCDAVEDELGAEVASVDCEGAAPSPQSMPQMVPSPKLRLPGSPAYSMLDKSTPQSVKLVTLGTLKDFPRT
jgi:hypothetical protein